MFSKIHIYEQFSNMLNSISMFLLLNIWLPKPKQLQICHDEFQKPIGNNCIKYYLKKIYVKLRK